MKKLLLHSCCGPCAIHVAEQLKNEYEVCLFFCESNIHPYEEYEKRLTELQKVAAMHKLNLYISAYDYERWRAAVDGKEAEPEGGLRCEACFFERLKETSASAKRMGFDAFATTLTVSPHKDAEAINNIGQKLAEKEGIEYLSSNFKKMDGFRKSMEKAREHNIYRQNYCGCEFSKK